MDLNTLLSLLSGDQANSTSYHHQSPTHSSPANASHARGHAQARAYSPNFDVIETLDAYILEGELPGLSDKRAVDIEFTDHQTLLVKGKIEKTTATTSAAQFGSKQITSGEEQQEEAQRPKSPPRPTVEDELVEDEEGKSTVSTPTSTVVSHPEEKKEQQQKDQVRYWVSERTIGSFQRTFSFPGLIDQDRVTAKLENGILTIVVPKRQKQPTRRIEIQ